jgi:hypothetical protein
VFLLVVLVACKMPGKHRVNSQLPAPASSDNQVGIEIGQKLPEIMAPIPMEVISKWKLNAGGQSVVSDPTGDDGSVVCRE